MGKAFASCWTRTECVWHPGRLLGQPSSRGSQIPEGALGDREGAAGLPGGTLSLLCLSVRSLWAAGADGASMPRPGLQGTHCHLPDARSVAVGRSLGSSGTRPRGPPPLTAVGRALNALTEGGRCPSTRPRSQHFPQTAGAQGSLPGFHGNLLSHSSGQVLRPRLLASNHSGAC